MANKPERYLEVARIVTAGSERGDSTRDGVGEKNERR
jgi:hypothetical protein